MQIASFQNANPDSPSHKLNSNANNLVDQNISGSNINNKQQLQQQQQQQSVVSLNNSSTESGPHTEQQLKYENERLKMALAQRYHLHLHPHAAYILLY